MPGNLYILGPGQGAQAVGMGKALFDASSTARDIFQTANRVVGFDLSALCFSGPEERLNQTDISQPAIYVTGIASFHHAVESGLFDAAAVTAYAGLSLGEYTALHLAGVFGFEEGLRLVCLRGKYMQEAAVASPSGMVALIGADEATARRLCREAAGGDVLVPANFNAPGQIVVSGAAAACQRLVKIAEAGGVRSAPLKVAGAFHSALMQSAADKMNAELARIAFSRPDKIVYSNVTAKPHGDPDSIKRLLVEQIVSPVRWEQTMQNLFAAGEARVIELSPGRTLAGLARRINRRQPVESLG
ncbi:MAG TPA: ACP S-malonyltransferase [Tepidisphaeraceae bacterium]|jgi:[acyl-carrier-protein] S-malonyltransferase|nr:ACP S-malonyltransferase [Tepidisphaeraceae bacterium]